MAVSRLTVLTVAACALALCGSTSSADNSSTPTKAAPAIRDWKPDAGLVDQLVDEIDLGGYAVRLPYGYSQMTHQHADGANGIPGTSLEAWAYHGIPRSDGKGSAILFQVWTMPHDAVAGFTLDWAIAGPLAEKRKTFTKLVVSPGEDGRINGLLFRRVYYKGLLNGVMTHGFLYVAIDDHAVVNFLGQDQEPYNSDSLPTAEASALTIRRATAP